MQSPEFLTLLDRLNEREELAFGNSDGVDLHLDDITYLARDVWRAKSAFQDPADSTIEKGLTRSMANLHFTRYRSLLLQQNMLGRASSMRLCCFQQEFSPCFTGEDLVNTIERGLAAQTIEL